MPIHFSKDQVIDRLRFDNPWWESGATDDYYSKMKHRAYFTLLWPLIIEKQIKRSVILMGPRRVGKTVLLFHTIEQLIQAGVPQKSICYFSIETPLYNGIALEELLNLFLKTNALSPKPI